MDVQLNKYIFVENSSNNFANNHDTHIYGGTAKRKPISCIIWKCGEILENDEKYF